MAKRTWRFPFPGFSKAAATGVGETPDYYLELTIKCMEDTQKMSSIQFNQEQCKHLAHKLKIIVQHAKSFLLRLKNEGSSSNSSAQEAAEVLELFKLLFTLAKEAECYIKGCCKEAWIQAAIVLTNVSEHISLMSFNLRLFETIFADNGSWGSTLAEVACLWDEEVANVKVKASEDKENFEMKLRASVQSNTLDSEEHELATFVLERSKSIRTPNARGSSHLSFFERGIMNLKTDFQKLGEGASASVYKATWLGVDVAMKIFDGPNNLEFKEEVSNLAGLCHPNIAALLCYGQDDRECSIILELMDDNLGHMMKNKLRNKKSCKAPFSIMEAMDMMLQIAQGMCYLHEMKIVHRDLKAANILVSFVKAEGVCCVQAKVADFGMSRTKESSKTYSYQKYVAGTTRWMAPEVINCKMDGHKVEDPFKIDVYSFGMVCYEILTGNCPFPTTPQRDVWSKVLAGHRPDLPGECPEELSILIKKCWSGEASMRPNFGEICAALRHLKLVLLLKWKALSIDLDDRQNPPSQDSEIEEGDLIFELADLGAQMRRSSTTINHSPSGSSNSLGGSQFVRLSQKLEESLLNLRRTHVLLLKNLSLAANVANQFYVSHSAQNMWVRTSIICHNGTGCSDVNSDQLSTIHSNVMPCSLYMSKLRTVRDEAAKSGGHGRYFPATILEEALSEEKSLIEKLREWRAKGEEFSFINHDKVGDWHTTGDRLLRKIEPGDVKTVVALFEGISAAVWKVLWQGGHFVRKDFWSRLDFNRELEVARKVSHPNIVYTFGVCIEEKPHSLFMELLDYDLSALISESRKCQVPQPTDYEPPFSRKGSLDILVQVAKAMAYLHKLGIVHMDLNPSNILAIYYESFGEFEYLVKVAGFSSARIMKSNSTSLYRSQLTTFKYTAPEVLRALYDKPLKLKYPKKMDVYSFGIVAFEVLTGLQPYGRIPEDWDLLVNSGVKKGVIEGTLRPCLREASSRTGFWNDPDLIALVERCWEQNPSHRPSFSKVVEGLERIQSRSDTPCAVQEKSLIEKLREWRLEGEEYPFCNHHKVGDGHSTGGRLLRKIEPGVAKTVVALFEGISASVWKVLWQGGHFVRKDFWSEGDFNRELEVARKVSHPNIVYTFGVCTEERPPSLFMELLDYDLSALISESRKCQVPQPTDYEPPFSRKGSLDILVQVAKAMAYLHKLGIVHMDLNPSNILAIYYESFGGEFEYLVNVAGFSSARIMKSNSTSLYRSQLTTFKYTAPEVLRALYDKPLKLKYPKKMDVYSFGIVAFEVLTGLQPYGRVLCNGTALKISEMEKGVREGILIPCLREASRRPNFWNDPDLIALVERCWEQNPSHRPSFSKVVEGLERIQNRLGRRQRSRSWSWPFSRPRSWWSWAGAGSRGI